MTDKIKILLISPLPPPLGGIATWSSILLDYYSSAQGQFHITHQNSAIKYRKITDLSFSKRVLGGIKDTLTAVKELKHNIATVNPDIIHLTSSASFALFKDLLLIQIAARKKKRIIIHFHFGRIPHMAKKKNWEWYLISKVITKSTSVIVIDESSYNTLAVCGFKNIVNIPNPISAELEEISQKLLERRVQDQNRIVFVGHVVAAKGVFELVESCATIPGKKELIFVGPYEQVVKDELIKRSEIKTKSRWIEFTGALDKNEVYRQIQNATVLILPSFSEGFPNVVLEAMALGCPVIATNVGAIPEMLDINSDNPSGICVSPKNVTELSNAIVTLLNDSVKATTMGNNGRKKILNNYTISSISGLYEKLWMDTIKNKDLKSWK
ncbi:glycosyltransferase family 4 protein [Chryseobacterium sp.]|uniref:glycosyltransferase family 4 protein n=1 Tax=Chryseobacterium sp. TaxID=1871047 RepID=UPI0011C7EAD5|nr:glycosyltransferase family 4 protein [Chryseobacterium sp.]TXF77533.1 glycosyltransferase family 4 protein [Chryseobacterium sp.]